MTAREADDFWMLTLSNFLTLRAGIANGAGKVLADAGFERPDIPGLDEPPGGLDQMLWECIWFETMAGAASTFARQQPTDEVAGAALQLAYLERVTKALNDAGPRPGPVVEAALFLSLASARHMQGAQGLPAAVQTMEAQLMKVQAGLKRGPQRKQELAELWRRPVRTFLRSLWETEPAMLKLDAKALWEVWLEREPRVVERLQRNREVKWPSERTAHGAVREMVRDIKTYH